MRIGFWANTGNAVSASTASAMEAASLLLQFMMPPLAVAETRGVALGEFFAIREIFLLFGKRLGATAAAVKPGLACGARARRPAVGFVRRRLRDRRADRARGVRAGGTGDAAVGVHRRTAEVEALDRSTVAGEGRDWTYLEDLVERELGVVRLPFRKPLARLAVARCEHAALDDLRAAPAQVLQHRLHHAIAETRPACVVPFAVGERIRRVLHADLDAMPTVRAWVRAARFEIRLARHVPVLGVVIRALEGFERRRDDQRREPGRPVERQRHLGDGAPAANVPHGADERRIEPAGVDEPEQGPLRIGAGDDERGGDLLAVRERDADRAPLAHGDLRDLGAAADLDAGTLAEHASDVRRRWPEHPRRAPDVVMEQQERCAAGARPLMKVHDRGRAEDRLERIALEPVVEEIRDRHRQEPAEILDPLPAQPPPRVEAEAGEPREIADLA